MKTYRKNDFQCKVLDRDGDFVLVEWSFGNQPEDKTVVREWIEIETVALTNAKVLRVMGHWIPVGVLL